MRHDNHVVRHHRNAAKHHQSAAGHHREAAMHHASGNYETAAHHAQAARGHAVSAHEYANEASKQHAMYEDNSMYQDDRGRTGHNPSRYDKDQEDEQDNNWERNGASAHEEDSQEGSELHERTSGRRQSQSSKIKTPGRRSGSN